MSRSLLFLVLFGVAGCGAAPTMTLGQIEASAGANTPENQDRRVIVEAAIHLAVTSLINCERDIPKLTKEHGGYLATASVDRTQGMHLTGRWIARIPGGQFETFIEAISKLGVPEKFDQQTQDVTEEFVDLEARIANEKQLETRIVNLLAETPGEIKTVLEVERELARVRGEIEKMEGRLKFLTNRTEFTTVTIVALERQKYVPPQAPTFSSRIAQAWWASVNILRECGETAIISVVFLAPWLLIVPVAMVAWWAIHRRRRPQTTTS